MPAIAMTDPVADRLNHDVMEGCLKSRRSFIPRTLGMSQIGKECERAIWYRFRGFTPRPLTGQAVRIFQRGDDIEARVIEDLTRAGFKVEGQQKTYLDHGGLFKGKADGIIHGVTGEPHILEIKSANDRRFKEIQGKGIKNAAPEYAGQGQCYMGYEGLNRCLFAVENKNTQALHFERMYFDTLEFTRLKAKAERIITADGLNPPPRAEPAKSPNSFACKWCDFSIWCWYPAEGVQVVKHCGACHYLVMNGFQRWCARPGHPYPIRQTGICCADYAELGGNGPAASGHPERVRPEQLTGFPEAAEPAKKRGPVYDASCGKVIARCDECGSLRVTASQPDTGACVLNKFRQVGRNGLDGECPLPDLETARTSPAFKAFGVKGQTNLPA